MQQIAAPLHQITRQAFHKKHFMYSQIAANWIDIVGEHYGKITMPHQIYQDILTIACSNTTAAELYYVSNTIMERINLYCGKKLITKIKFTHKKIVPPSFPSEKNRSSSSVQPVTLTDLPPGPLYEALARLGGQVKTRKQGKI